MFLHLQRHVNRHSKGRIRSRQRQIPRRKIKRSRIRIRN
ncbi:hypothetical protein Gotur_004498 [Gossypium turneri]